MFAQLVDSVTLPRVTLRSVPSDSVICHIEHVSAAIKSCGGSSYRTPRFLTHLFLAHLISFTCLFGNPLQWQVLIWNVSTQNSAVPTPWSLLKEAEWEWMKLCWTNSPYTIRQTFDRSPGGNKKSNSTLLKKLRMGSIWKWVIYFGGGIPGLGHSTRR